MGLSGVAQETLSIIERGSYVAPSGATVSVREAVDDAVGGTRTYAPGELRAPGARGARAPVEVTWEKTSAAGRRLLSEGHGAVAVLNFASAKNPGGGFLGGARAQEEDLARCSALYACLSPQRAYYDANRACQSMLYTDHVIWSPGVPFFRDESLELLEEPFLLSVVTAPAPNAGEERGRNGAWSRDVGATLRRRAGLVLGAAAEAGHRVLVLGAWGCGVFRNDPDQVAEAFEDALIAAGSTFERVVFAVWERGGDGPNLDAFRRRFG